MMTLREWAQLQGIHPQTAYGWYREGKLPVPDRKVGKLILVGDLEPQPRHESTRTVIYARVSSADQKGDLDAQVARVVTWATEHGHSLDQVITEVGSVLNGHRRKFLGILRDPTIGAIIVEHRDRFCRFGAEYVEAALDAQGPRLIVVDPSEVDDDLARDATELLTSLCARLYGRRSAEHRAKRAVEVACAEAVT